MTDDVLHAMAQYDNICNFIHLPVQSGNSRILEMMRRGYTREWYLHKIDRIRTIVPQAAISTDIIAGFCSETEEEHQATLSLMEQVHYDHAFMFYYSERPGTLAARKFEDDVPLADKKRRLAEIIELQNRHCRESHYMDIGQTFRVLIEGDSKRSAEDFCGRNSQNKMLVFPKENHSYQPGDYVDVYVQEASSATLKGRIV
jgi:tRNA-2-methylthio-N6-dimethylallyladenosine synthase